MNTNYVIACIFGAFTLAVNSCGGDSDSDSSESVLKSAMEKAEQGRGTEMSYAEMDAFRQKQQDDSRSHRQSIRSGLSQEEKALQDYEDAMILKGETKSNPHYEELQRKARESR